MTNPMRIVAFTSALFCCSLLMAQGKAPCSAKSSCCASKKTTTTASAPAPMSCNLTAEAQHERKSTVIASLRTQVLERQELENGYAFRFVGSDDTVAELSRFIELESECCPFYVFDLDVAEDKSAAWLKMTGPEGVKEVIRTDLAL